MIDYQNSEQVQQHRIPHFGKLTSLVFSVRNESTSRTSYRETYNTDNRMPG
ncbi:MAG: hypothetical protein ACYC2P_09355 [Paludibacteraceae bacterium]